MHSPTLPAGIPRLDEIVRAEADRLAVEFAEAWSVVSGAPHLGWATLNDETKVKRVAVHERFLRDITRPESRDWAARALADLVRLADDESRASTAPSWGIFECGEHSEGDDGAMRECAFPIWSLALGDRHEPTMVTFAACGDYEESRRVVPGIDRVTDPAEALALAIAAVCRDG